MISLSYVQIAAILYLGFVAVRYFFFSRSESTTMSHGKVITIDNIVIYKALTSSGPVVIDFFATWCAPCRHIAPRVGQLSETYPAVRFLQVDVDKFPQIAAELGVSAMPTFVFFKDGKPLPDRVIGANVRALEDKVKQLATA